MDPVEADAEHQANKWAIEDDPKAQGDVEEALADGDKEAEKAEAQVNKEDGDFDPDNPAEDEVEPVPADEADDAGMHVCEVHACVLQAARLDLSGSWL